MKIDYIRYNNKWLKPVFDNHIIVPIYEITPILIDDNSTEIKLRINLTRGHYSGSLDKFITVDFLNENELTLKIIIPSKHNKLSTELFEFAKDNGNTVYAIIVVEILSEFLAEIQIKLFKEIKMKEENFLKQYNERIQQLESSIVSSGDLTDDDASLIIEEVIDTLIEVGNGTTDEQLYKMGDYLLAFRDKWLNKRIKI